MKFMEKQPRFNDDEHAKAWLLRVTINLSKNMLKASWRKNKSETEEALYQENQSDEVLSCVMRLEENYRTVIHLYYYEGYSTAEISEMIGINHSTLRTYMAKGREKLKMLLEEEEI